MFTRNPKELKAKHFKGKGKERTQAVSLPKTHTKVELVKVKREPSDDSAENGTEELLPGNNQALF